MIMVAIEIKIHIHYMSDFKTQDKWCDKFVIIKQQIVHYDKNKPGFSKTKCIQDKIIVNQGRGSDGDDEKNTPASPFMARIKICTPDAT